MSDVQSPASLVVFTQLGRVYRCDSHARALVLELMENMRCFAFCGPAQAGVECATCVNESNGQPRPHNGGTREVSTKEK